jgi:hypothetical protein
MVAETVGTVLDTPPTFASQARRGRHPTAAAFLSPIQDLRPPLLEVTVAVPAFVTAETMTPIKRNRLAIVKVEPITALYSSIYMNIASSRTKSRLELSPATLIDRNVRNRIFNKVYPKIIPAIAPCSNKTCKNELCGMISVFGPYPKIGYLKNWTRHDRII